MLSKPSNPAAKQQGSSFRVTDMGKVIGIDIGGTSFRIGAVDEAGTVSEFQKIPVKQVLLTEDPLQDLTTFLRSYSEGIDVEAIAIGFPATLDAERQTVLQAPNIAFMENLPVVKVLSEELKIPVFIERDVTMALYYDCQKYHIPNQGIVCGFYFGTGIGNAISINGVPLVGKNGTAGELGHIPVDGSDEVCGCGNVGCMENLAGGKYLEHLRSVAFKGTHISDIFYKYPNDTRLHQFVDRMAMTVATEINILNPHVILIGGGVPAMAGFPKEYLLERIRFHARKPYPANGLNIIFTEDEKEKCVIGAAIYARDSFIKKAFQGDLL